MNEFTTEELTLIVFALRERAASLANRRLDYPADFRAEIDSEAKANRELAEKIAAKPKE